ncbi:MAG: type I-F CRISPR-associated helicase Cas3f [Psychrobacter sp.]|nr:type I-F CRISPR-associated helicase Cas3f [Psychrobacter sp.]
MIVTFVSQCEKKSLKHTRRILDSFANRIGDNVWQTAITEEGLATVHELLSKSARRSTTAVSCHRIKSRKQSQLVWIVGNKQKFDELGIVPVNTTEQDISIYQDSHQWHNLPVMRYAAAIAGLFHDFGKANVLFQDKINPKLKTDSFEPYRHEWVSLRLFEAFVAEAQTDLDWLDKLISNENSILENLYRDGLANPQTFTNPLTTLPPFARLVAWLVVSHHKLPSYPAWKPTCRYQPEFSQIDQWLNDFTPVWNSPNCLDDDQQARLTGNWTLPTNNLPFNSQQWVSYACLLASQAKQDLLPLLSSIDDKTDYLKDELFTSHLARLALMLADHHVSSFSINETHEELRQRGWRSERYPIYANTYWVDDNIKDYKQQLDEHLIGVAHHAERIIKALPKFKSDLRGLDKNSFLEDNVKKALKLRHEGEDKEDKIKVLLEKFEWQDGIKKVAEQVSQNTLSHGFFGINMASTGSGKTLANAKVMYALGKASGQIRFNVALGLRTLTLQTGKEFQEALELSKEDLSITVGGIAVKALFENKDDNERNSENDKLGSPSADDYLNPDLFVDYSGENSPHALSKWTNRKGKERTEKLLQPPVLVCTIDHLIPATEGTRGGQQIAPMLRLLTSDLILDEPDDFGLTDLPALCRLIHWSAMLGSRVMLSTATMPPALVYECFNAYRIGWQAFAKANLEGWDGAIQCAWFDEKIKPQESLVTNPQDYKSIHDKFVNKRIKALEQLKPKRLGKVVVIKEDNGTPILDISQAIYASIIELHHLHQSNNAKAKNIDNQDEQSDKTVTIGLVRMANIDPIVAVAKTLLDMDAPPDTCIHYCVYHSRYALAVRSHLEDKLDSILSRKNEQNIWQDDVLGNIINNHPAKHHIFVVIASPVAEVGRDHDYDWAVIEPSSMRSIIQIAGRVLRHRDIYPTSPNIFVLNKNLKALANKDICFTRPGFESNTATIEEDSIINKLTLPSHQLNDSLLNSALNDVPNDIPLKLSNKKLNSILREGELDIISATPRISLFNFERVVLAKPTRQNKAKAQYKHLTALEHMALFETLTKGSKPANVWWQQHPHWCGEVQRQQRFRDSTKDTSYRIYFSDEYHDMTFKWMNTDKRPPELGDPLDDIKIENYHPTGNNSRFWFDLNPLTIYQQLMTDFALPIADISVKFGEFRITNYGDHQSKYFYHDNLGIYSKR